MRIRKKCHSVIDFVFILPLPFFMQLHIPKRTKCPSPLGNKHFAKVILQRGLFAIVQDQRYLATYTFEIKTINVKVIVIIEKNTIGIWFANFGSLFSLMIIALILPPDTTLQ